MQAKRPVHFRSHPLRTRYLSPLTWPVYSFALVIFLGSLGLWWSASLRPGVNLTYIDALFTATSAVCVTGLSSVDVSSTFSSFGLSLLLLLIQLGGLGITTYTSLMFLLLRNKVPFTDRLAVTQALLSDAFDLGAYLRHVVLLVLTIEAVGAVCLYLAHPDLFTPAVAVFHAVSAFCNAGFSTFSDNLMAFQQDWAVNLPIMLLIVLGGLGFTVLDETRRKCTRGGRHLPLSRYARIVYATTAFLVFGGALLIWLTETRNPASPSYADLILPSLFQSVTARTAGFNTVSLSSLTSASLLILMALMFVGGSPGSCAGGIKTTTFRVLSGFVKAQVSGRHQVVIHGRAAGAETQNRALTLFFLAVCMVTVSTLVLAVTESSFVEHSHAPVRLLDLLFEVISGFATVGLTTGVTPTLSVAGKSVIILNMFVGRVGLFTLILALQSFRHARTYSYPEGYLPLG